MAREYTPKRGAHAGQSFSSYYQYTKLRLSYQPGFSGSVKGYYQEKRQQEHQDDSEYWWERLENERAANNGKASRSATGNWASYLASTGKRSWNATNKVGTTPKKGK